MINFSKFVKRTELRQTATSRLKEGSAPSSHGTISNEALNTLYDFSKMQGNSKDVLTLLHELQVHQVELDLQHEQIEANSIELSEDLSHYREMFEYSPIASFIISHDGCIMEGNIAGFELLGCTQREIDGRYIESFLNFASLSTLSELRTRLLMGSSRASCEVQFNAETSNRTWQIMASVMPSNGSFMLSFVETKISLKP